MSGGSPFTVIASKTPEKMEMGKATGNIIDYDVGMSANVCVVIEINSEENELYCFAEAFGNANGQLGKKLLWDAHTSLIRL